MSRQNKMSLKGLIKIEYDSMLGIGRSKHEDKKTGSTNKYIYSWETYRSYLKQACYFAEYVKSQPVDPALGHKPRTLEEARQYVERWLEENINRVLSSYTIKLQASALAKLYHCKTTDFNVETPSRSRLEVTRSRGPAIRDKDFIEDLSLIKFEVKIFAKSEIHIILR